MAQPLLDRRAQAAAQDGMTATTRIEEIADLGALEQRWRALEVRAGETSFFLRWTWIGSWLAALRQAGIALPKLFVVQAQDGADIALALLGEARMRRKLGAVPALWLNEVGHSEGDRPFIEYNGLLCREGAMPQSVHAFCEAMAGVPEWRALHLSGMAFGSPLIDVPSVRRRVLRDASPAYYVDLAEVRAADNDYLSLLSANTRGQIRRSIRDEPGHLPADVARDTETAEAWLSEMARLNAGHHEDEAWDSEFFRNFARRILSAGMEDGTVEMLHVLSGGGTLGYLLNFVWAGSAMNYQSAFAAPRTAKSKPGLMCHTAAVAHYAGRGLARYSLLAGKDRYKQSLSTGAEMLEWWTLERFDWRLEAEAILRRIFRR